MKGERLMLPSIPRNKPLILVLDVSSDQKGKRVDEAMTLSISTTLVQMVLQQLLLLLVFSKRLLHYLARGGKPDDMLQQALSLASSRILALVVIDDSIAEINCWGIRASKVAVGNKPFSNHCSVCIAIVVAVTVPERITTIVLQSKIGRIDCRVIPSSFSPSRPEILIESIGSGAIDPG